MTRIFTNTPYGEYETQYVEVTESYDFIKKIMYNYIKNGYGFGDRFIELHLAKGKFANKPILIKLSSIQEVFDITEDKIDDQL